MVALPKEVFFYREVLMSNTTEYPTPDQLDTLIDQAQMSPEQEAWCVAACFDYRMACQQVKLAIEYNNRKSKETSGA